VSNLHDTEDDALDIARKLLYDNAVEIYGLPG
jgi:hypothetical protein